MVLTCISEYMPTYETSVTELAPEGQHLILMMNVHERLFPPVREESGRISSCVDGCAFERWGFDCNYKGTLR